MKYVVIIAGDKYFSCMNSHRVIFVSDMEYGSILKTDSIYLKDVMKRLELESIEFKIFEIRVGQQLDIMT